MTTSFEWTSEQERLTAEEFANHTGLLMLNASNLANHNMLRLTLTFFIMDLEAAKMGDDKGTVRGPKETYGVSGWKERVFVRSGDEWLIKSRSGQFLDEEEGIDVDIAVEHTNSPFSRITYQLPDSPPFIIAKLGYRGGNSGVFSAERGYEGNDPERWWTYRPKILSRWLHGKAPVDDEQIYATEVQVAVVAMPFETSEEVIRCFCYVLGAKPEYFKRRRGIQNNEADAKATDERSHGAEL